MKLVECSFSYGQMGGSLVSLCLTEQTCPVNSICIKHILFQCNQHHVTEEWVK